MRRRTAKHGGGDTVTACARMASSDFTSSNLARVSARTAAKMRCSCSIVRLSSSSSAVLVAVVVWVASAIFAGAYEGPPPAAAAAAAASASASACSEADEAALRGCPGEAEGRDGVRPPPC